MKKTFSYMFLDNKLHTKILDILFVLLLIFSCIFILDTYNAGKLELKILVLFFNFVVSVLFAGYKISVVKFLDTNSEKIVFPIISMKKIFASGFRYVVSFLIFSLPLFCLFFAFAYTWILSRTNVGSNLLVLILGCLFVLTTIFCLFCLISFIPAATLIFIKTNSVWSFYKFEEIFQIIFSNLKKYAKYAIVYFLLDTLFCGLFELLNIFGSNSLLLSFVLIIPILLIALYITLVNSYLIAEFKNNVKELLC